MSDSENSETGGIREKLVDYTESSELEDKTSENCQINVDHDFNTDHHNIKDPMIGGKLLPADAQPSSDYNNQDKIPISKLAMLEGNSEEKIKSEELFSSDNENRSNSIVDDIISKLDIKDPLAVKSMEAYWLDNSDKLLTDAIHKSAVLVSETDEVINTGPVESTSDTTISTTKLDSDSDAELVIVQKKRRRELMTLLIL